MTSLYIALLFASLCSIDQQCKDHDKIQTDEQAYYVERGALSAYNQLPTDATLQYRIEIGDIPQDITAYDVFIAVRDCGRIGEDATMHTSQGSFRAKIFDCGGSERDGGLMWMLENGIVAEADWYFWDEHPEIVGSFVEIEYQE